jgi:hypothetical protein
LGRGKDTDGTTHKLQGEKRRAKICLMNRRNGHKKGGTPVKNAGKKDEVMSEFIECFHSQIAHGG